MSGSLTGVGVLVTRPAHQAATLCQLLEEQGATPFSFPVIDIAAPADTTIVRDVLTHLREFNLAIFISPNAVIHAWDGIQAAGGLPPGLTVAAVGPGSARELAKRGWLVDLVPAERFDSEALLALPRLNAMHGQRVIIFRGEGGRELLADELIRRGATVTYAEVYRRINPTTDPSELLNRIARDEIHWVVITSTVGLRNLYDLVGAVGQEWLRTVSFVVFSERVVSLARELGLRGSIHVTRQATDAAVMYHLTGVTVQTP